MCLVISFTLGLCGRIEVHAIVVSVNEIDRHASKRNFHRPQSNCGMALNSGASFHSASTTATAANQAPRQSRAQYPNQKEMFQSEFSGVGFLFMPLSQAFEDRTF